MQDLFSVFSGVVLSLRLPLATAEDWIKSPSLITYADELRSAFGKRFQPGLFHRVVLPQSIQAKSAEQLSRLLREDDLSVQRYCHKKRIRYERCVLDAEPYGTVMANADGFAAVTMDGTIETLDDWNFFLSRRSGPLSAARIDFSKDIAKPLTVNP